MDFDTVDEDASAMAAAMGFSSFGSHKPPAKKRKFNHATDAFISGQELESIDRGGKKGKGSGGNMMPLGKARQFGTEQKNTSIMDVNRNPRNDDEITLDNDDEEEDGGACISIGNLPVNEGDQAMDADDGPRYMDTSLPPPAGGETQEDPGPQWLDTSEDAPLEVQKHIDALLQRLKATPAQERANSILEGIKAKSPPAENDGVFPTSRGSLLPPPPKNLPSRPAFSDTAFMQGGPQGGHNASGSGSGRAFSDTASVASSRPSQRGEKNPTWYVGYYDPSFNENPWGKLEADLGLKSVGTWVERPKR